MAEPKPNRDIMDSLIIWIGVGILFIVFTVIGFVLLAWYFARPDKDFLDIALGVSIVIVAVFQVITTAMLAILLIELIYTAKSIRQFTYGTLIPKIDATSLKVDEVLDHTRSITGNVRESIQTTTTTTVFVAEQVVSPIIRVSSLIAGVRAAVKALAHHHAPSEHPTDAHSLPRN